MATKLVKSFAIDVVKNIIADKTESFIDNINNVDVTQSDYHGKIIFKDEQAPVYNTIEISNLFEMLHLLACTSSAELNLEFFNSLQTYQLIAFYKAYVATVNHDNEFADELLELLLVRK